MIDLLVMEEKVKKIVSIGCGNSYVATALEAIELITRLRQAEKDAARYRWLREQPCGDWEVDGYGASHIDVTMWRNDGFDNCNSGESLSGDPMDAAIDEAMQCNK